MAFWDFWQNSTSDLNTTFLNTTLSENDGSDEMMALLWWLGKFALKSLMAGVFGAAGALGVNKIAAGSCRPKVLLKALQSATYALGRGVKKAALFSVFGLAITMIMGFNFLQNMIVSWSPHWIVLYAQSHHIKTGLDWVIFSSKGFGRALKWGGRLTGKVVGGIISGLAQGALKTLGLTGYAVGMSVWLGVKALVQLAFFLIKQSLLVMLKIMQYTVLKMLQGIWAIVSYLPKKAWRGICSWVSPNRPVVNNPPQMALPAPVPAILPRQNGMVVYPIVNDVAGFYDQYLRDVSPEALDSYFSVDDGDGVNDEEDIDFVPDERILQSLRFLNQNQVVQQQNRVSEVEGPPRYNFRHRG